MPNMPPSLRTSAPLLQAASLLIGLAVASYLYVWHAAGTPLLDFEVYRGAAERLQAGVSLYSEPFHIPVEQQQIFHVYYLYPPLLAALIQPWLGTESLLPYLWCGVGLGALLVSAWLLAQMAPPSFPVGRRATFLILLFLLLCFEPVYWGAREGQVDAIVLLLLCGWLYGLHNRNEFGAGFVLGLAIWIKMSPAILLLGALRFRRWRVLWGVLLASLSAVLLILAVPNGVIALRDFFSWLPELTAGELLANYTYNFAFDRALVGALGLMPTAGLLTGIKVFIVGSVALLLSKMPATSGSDLGYSATAVSCMVFVSPVLWFHHLAWLFIAITFLLYCARRDERRLFWVGLLFLLLSQSNTMYGTLVKILPTAQNIWRLLPGLLIIWCIVWCIVAAARAQRERGTPP